MDFRRGRVGRRLQCLRVSRWPKGAAKGNGGREDAVKDAAARRRSAVGPLEGPPRERHRCSGPKVGLMRDKLCHEASDRIATVPSSFRWAWRTSSTLSSPACRRTGAADGCRASWKPCQVCLKERGEERGLETRGGAPNAALRAPRAPLLQGLAAPRARRPPSPPPPRPFTRRTPRRARVSGRRTRATGQQARAAGL